MLRAGDPGVLGVLWAGGLQTLELWALVSCGAGAWVSPSAGRWGKRVSLGAGQPRGGHV